MDQTPEEWLADLFEFETCAECGGDAADHEVCLVPGIGNYFARCRRSVDDPDAMKHGTGADGIGGSGPRPADAWRDTAGGGGDYRPRGRHNDTASSTGDPT